MSTAPTPRSIRLWPHAGLGEPSWEQWEVDGEDAEDRLEHHDGAQLHQCRRPRLVEVFQARGAAGVASDELASTRLVPRRSSMIANTCEVQSTGAIVGTTSVAASSSSCAVRSRRDGGNADVRPSCRAARPASEQQSPRQRSR